MSGNQLRVFRSLSFAMLLMLSATLASATTGQITFRSISSNYFYVAVTTNCATGFANVRILALPPSQITTILAEGPICYGYSVYARPAEALWGTGRATPGDTVDIPGSYPLMRVTTADQRKTADEPDSTIFAGAAVQERAKTMARALPGISTFQVATAGTPATVERSLVSWLDQTSRQSTTDCVQEAIIDIPFDGQIRTCTGWRTRWRCPRNEAVLVVQTLDVNRANQAITNCLGTAAVAGALAAIASGGTAAVAAAEAAFVACMGDAIINAHIEIRGGWTDWGGC